jgi:NADPH:quinone reductase-like Zn-dependent oxidoreductase
MGTKAEMVELLRLVEEKKVKPHIGNVLDLREASEGHRLMECGESIGKIALNL